MSKAGCHCDNSDSGLGHLINQTEYVKVCLAQIAIKSIAAFKLLCQKGLKAVLYF